jgi:hypothetical protein
VHRRWMEGYPRGAQTMDGGVPTGCTDDGGVPTGCTDDGAGAQSPQSKSTQRLPLSSRLARVGIRLTHSRLRFKQVPQPRDETESKPEVRALTPPARSLLWKPPAPSLHTQPALGTSRPSLTLPCRLLPGDQSAPQGDEHLQRVFVGSLRAQVAQDVQAPLQNHPRHVRAFCPESGGVCGEPLSGARAASRASPGVPSSLWRPILSSFGLRQYKPGAQLRSLQLY